MSTCPQYPFLGNCIKYSNIRREVRIERPVLVLAEVNRPLVSISSSEEKKRAPSVRLRLRDAIPPNLGHLRQRDQDTGRSYGSAVGTPVGNLPAYQSIMALFRADARQTRGVEEDQEWRSGGSPARGGFDEEVVNARKERQQRFNHPELCPLNVNLARSKRAAMHSRQRNRCTHGAGCRAKAPWQGECDLAHLKAACFRV